MKNLFKLNEKDNAFTAFAKGGLKGILISVAGMASIVGTAAIVGTVIKHKGEDSVLEEVLESVEDTIEE